MKDNLIRLLWLPLLLFAVFLAVGAYTQTLLHWIALDPPGRGNAVLTYTLQIAVWISGAWFVIRATNVLVWDRLVAAALGRPIPRLLKDLISLLILMLAATGIVGVVFEQSIVGVWATSGVLGLILGFALRNIILDIFTGLAINLDSSYQIGDWVEIHNNSFKEPVFGRVLEINWRTTRLELETRNVMIVPNNMMGIAALTNYSAPTDLARFEVVFVLDFSVPAERALRILLAGVKAAIGANGPVAVPEPRVLVGEATESGVRYRVRYFVCVSDVSPSTGRHSVTRSILEQLTQAGLTPAGVKQDVFYARRPERNLDTTALADRVALLARVELFQKSLRLEELQELADAVQPRLCKAGQELIRQGDAGMSMFVLAEGLVYVYDEHNGGERVKIAQLLPGQTFGEMSLLTGEPRSATVVAETDLVVFEIAKDHMQALLAKRPVIAEMMSSLVAERRLRSVQARTDTLTEPSPAEKQNLYRQMLGKMKRFFGSVGENATAG